MDRESQAHAASMDYTLKELQRKLREHETELEKVSTYLDLSS